MIKKTYTSMTVPHFSVGKRRISFMPLASRKSYFETTDEELQKKLEAHPWFGDKFTLKSTVKTGDDGEKTDGDAGDGKDTGNKDAGILESKTFATLADAKEWLAKEFGAVRSNIRTIADAESIGKANGVEVVIGTKTKAADGDAGDGKGTETKE